MDVFWRRDRRDTPPVEAGFPRRRTGANYLRRRRGGRSGCRPRWPFADHFGGRARKRCLDTRFQRRTRRLRGRVRGRELPAALSAAFFAGRTPNLLFIAPRVARI